MEVDGGMKMKKLLGNTILCSLLWLSLSPASAPVSAATSLPLAGSINLNEDTDDFIVSDVMTYDEIIQRIATDSEISIEEAKEIFGPQSISKSGKAINYRTFSKTLNVSIHYKPSINFYCETDESGSFYGIRQVKNVSINRKSNNMSAVYDGEIFVHLENGSTIYYMVNGDFYTNGTVSFSGSLNLGIGESKAVISVVSSGSHYAYLYQDGTYYWR